MKLVLLLVSILCIKYSHSATWTGDFAKFSTWSYKESYGKDQRQFILDPKGSGETVLKVNYPKDSYSGTAIKGTGFYVYPIANLSATITTLEYEILFPTEFEWVKGGKLPGTFGGRQSCSGGDSAIDCYSARFMWGKNGTGDAYLYLPKNASHLPEFCAMTDKKDCSQAFGFHFNNSAFFTKDKWYHIKEHVELNTPGNPDGILRVWVNGVKKIDYNKIIYRSLSSVTTKGFVVETFFGGSTEDWKTPIDTYTLYKGFKFYDY